MKKIYSLFLSALILLLSSFFAEAKISIGDSVLIEQPSEEEIFFIGDEIVVTAPLKSEFIGIGRNITAVSEAKGDFIAVGYNVNFKGNSEQDIYLAGGNITVEGDMKGSIAILGKNVTIKGDISGNLRVSAENITIEGTVIDKTILWGKNIAISGNFNDLSVYGTHLHFNPDTTVKGALSYSSSEDTDLSNITVLGETYWRKPFNEQMKEKLPWKIFKRFYGFFSLLIPVLMTLLFFPNLFQQTVEMSGRKFIPSFFGGLFLIISSLLLILISFITIIGVPLGLILTMSLSALVYIARIFPAIFVSRKILFKMQDKTFTWILATLIGILLFTTISRYAPAKIILNLICIPVGCGALSTGRLKLLKRLRDEKIL